MTNKKTKSIQSRVADEALERAEEIRIGGRTYRVAPPSTATLILVSEAVAELPLLDLKSDSLVTDVLREAKRCRPVGKAVATMILGARKAQEGQKEVTVEERFGPFGIFKREVVKTMPAPLAVLSEELLYAPPAELQTAFAVLVQRMQLGDFFGLTTFLNGINITRPTREVRKGTTASGR